MKPDQPIYEPLGKRSIRSSALAILLRYEGRRTRLLSRAEADIVRRDDEKDGREGEEERREEDKSGESLEKKLKEAEREGGEKCGMGALK